MKGLYVCMIMFCCMVCRQASGADKLHYIEAQTIHVAVNKTTNLVFHYRIKQVDVGSADILAKLCNDTVLLVKAAKADFAESNISIYTADGKLHAFTVSYAERPEHLYLRVADEPDTAGSFGERKTMEAGGGGHVSVSGPPVAVTENIIEANCSLIGGSNGSRRRLLRHRHGMVGLTLLRPRIQNDLFYFPLEISNHSSISYQVGQLRCFVRDKRRIRRTASQEQEVRPLYVFGDGSYIPGQHRQWIVVVLPRFSLPDAAFLRISFTEKEGCRDLWVDVRGKILEKAIKLTI